MKSKVMKRILTVILCILMAFSSTATAFAASPATTVTAAKYYLTPYEDAVAELEEIVKEREIFALVYLCDAYSLRESADPNSEEVAMLASGQQVIITGVSQDSGSNIWYQVDCAYEDGTLTGYIQRDNLAFSDERLKEWEDKYVRSRMRSFFRMAARTSADIEQFPDSYKQALYKLKETHPDWIFVKMNTGLEWNSFLAAECAGDRSLISYRVDRQKGRTRCSPRHTEDEALVAAYRAWLGNSARTASTRWRARQCDRGPRPERMQSSRPL